MGNTILSIFPDFPDEAISINSEADPFAFGVPVPDGKYDAILSLAQSGAEKKSTKEGKAYISINVQANIVAPGVAGVDNRVVFDRVTTLINKNGTSRSVGLLQAAGVSVQNISSQAGLAEAVVQALQGNATASITTRQEAYCKDCGKTTLRGQSKFKDGKAACPKCGADLAAKVAVTAYSTPE